MEGLKNNQGWLDFLKDFGKVYEIADLEADAFMNVYDNVAERYAKYMPITSTRIDQMLTDILFKCLVGEGKLGKDCNILDVCCGTGILGICLRKSGFSGRLIGLDGSKNMLAQCAKLENVYDELHNEVIRLDCIKTLPENQFDILTAGHAFFPDSLHDIHITSLLSLLTKGGFLSFDLNYDKVNNSEAMAAYISKIDAKIAQLIDDKVCERVFECDVEDIITRLPHVSPGGDSDTMHQRHICLKKL